MYAPHELTRQATAQGIVLHSRRWLKPGHMDAPCPERGTPCCSTDRVRLVYPPPQGALHCDHAPNVDTIHSSATCCSTHSLSTLTRALESVSSATFTGGQTPKRNNNRRIGGVEPRFGYGCARMSQPCQCLRFNIDRAMQAALIAARRRLDQICRDLAIWSFASLAGLPVPLQYSYLSPAPHR